MTYMDLAEKGFVEFVCRGDGRPCPAAQSCEVGCQREFAVTASRLRALKKVLLPIPAALDYYEAVDEAIAILERK